MQFLSKGGGKKEADSFSTFYDYYSFSLVLIEKRANVKKSPAVLDT